MIETPEEFVARFVSLMNTHNPTVVGKLVAEDAVYFFTNAVLRGRPAVEAAMGDTWKQIHDEVYEVIDVEWLLKNGTVAVYTYKFHWTGKIGPIKAEKHGRGTNVIVLKGGEWYVQHVHLSNPPLW